MSNPWEAVPLETYEAHMKSTEVGQLPVLSEIMKRQLARCAAGTVCVLGIAGGNGLEHIDLSRTRRVYGIDVSATYLSACRQRFAVLGDRLSLMQMDLKEEASRLPQADTVIADLLVEYIGIEAFAQLIAAGLPAAVCCAVQKSGGASFISESACAEALRSIGNIHQDIEPEALAAAMERIGYRQAFREDVPLPGSKQLVCIDFLR